MTKEAFVRDMLYRLKTQALAFPAAQREDAVKFVFQGMLGVGHLLPERKNAAADIACEMDGLPADPGEPLFEILSPAWCRLNLRRAKAEHIQPRVIAGMMLASGGVTPFTRQDVYDCCRRLDESGESRPTDETVLDRILEDDWLPSHSVLYRERYHPAYRVVSVSWIPCMEALQRIAQKERSAGRMLITLDGPCASGKTTLARKLARVFEAAVVHTDDFVIPHNRKTPERLAIPGGNCDAERLVREVAAPFKKGCPVRYRRYDCVTDTLLPEEQLVSLQMLILEGSYCNLPEIRKYADMRLFLNAPWKIREARLLERESPNSMQQFYKRWIPLENAYFAAYHLPDEGCVTIGNGDDSPDACSEFLTSFG